MVRYLKNSYRISMRLIGEVFLSSLSRERVTMVATRRPHLIPKRWKVNCRLHMITQFHEIGDRVSSKTDLCLGHTISGSI